MKIRKFIIESVLCGNLFAKLLGFLFNNKIPSWRFGVARFNCSEKTISNKIRAAIFWGVYESSELRLINKHLDDKFPVIELGASLGIVSTHIKKKIKSKELICVEANPMLGPIIDANLKLNNCRNFQIISKAIAPKGVSKILFEKGETNLVGQLAYSQDVGHTEVEVIDFDTIVSSLQSRYYNMVCDIEGAEIILLKEFKKALSDCRILIIELHDSYYQGIPYSRDHMCHLIEQLGFEKIDCHGAAYMFSKK